MPTIRTPRAATAEDDRVSNFAASKPVETRTIS
jgi:hypothetical protein